MSRITLSGLALFGVFVFGFASVAVAQETTPPRLKYVLTYKADLAPAQAVAANRSIYNVTGGWLKTADGDKGTLIQPCGDWLHVLPSGTLKLDVRCTIKMDDES